MNDFNILPTLILRATASRKQNPPRVPGTTLPQKVAQTMAVILAVLFLASHSVAAQVLDQAPANTFGLSLKDLKSVVQKSIDLPALQQYYPRNSDRSLKPLTIVQLPLALPAGLELTAGGKPVSLLPMSRAGLSKLSVDSYAMFRSIEAAGNTVNVRFNQFYTPVGQSRRTVFVTLELQNSANGWNVINSTVKDAAL